MFAKKGQLDWAALCSTNGASSILIFWGGPKNCPDEISNKGDRDQLQRLASGVEYSRMIGSVGEKEILQFHDVFGGPKPPPIDHEGIDDISPA
jgi:hypothetical protein